MTERIQLLNVWILLCLLLTARTYCYDDMVDRSLKTIYKTTLGLDSWGVTLTLLTLTPEEGGFSLAMPDVWLRVQAGLAFIKHMAHLESFPTLVGEHFQSWAFKFGVCLHVHAIPYLQPGPVSYHTMGYLA